MQLIDRVLLALDQAALKTDDRRKLLIVGTEEAIETLRRQPGARSLWGNLPECFRGHARMRGSFAQVPVAAIAPDIMMDGLTFMLGDQVVGGVIFSRKLSAAMFRKICEALYGESWKTAVWQKLSIDDRTIRRIMTGEREVPDGAARDLIEILDRRILELTTLRTECGQ